MENRAILALNIMQNRLYSIRNNKKIWYTLGKTLWSIFRAILLVGLCFIILYPMMYMLSVALRPKEELFDPIVIWIPRHVTLQNFSDSFRAMKYMSSMMTTVRVGVISSLLQILSAALVGYGFARFRFKGRDLFFALVLFTMIVPPQTVIIPMSIQFKYFDFLGLGSLAKLVRGTPLQINLLNSVWTFYLPAIFGTGIRSGFFIYIFRQFFRGLPKELEDAAYIDGCSPFATFVRVMAPNATPAFLTAILFSVVWYWNDFFYAVMFFNNLKTISLALNTMQDNTYLSLMGMGNDPAGKICALQAACGLAVAPILAVYILLQKYFTESIERTGIVG